MRLWGADRDGQLRVGTHNHESRAQRTSKNRNHASHADTYSSQFTNPAAYRDHGSVVHESENRHRLKKQPRTRKAALETNSHFEDRKQYEPLKPQHEQNHGDTVYQDQMTTKIRSSVDGRPKLGNESSNEQVVMNGVNLWSWIPYVAQPADDATVSGRVKELFVIAEQYVNNFYTNREYDSNIPDDILEQVNTSPLLSTSQLQKCLSKVDYQTPFIKHILVSLLLDLISFGSNKSKLSLLPIEFQNFSILANARTRSESSSNEIPCKLRLGLGVAAT